MNEKELAEIEARAEAATPGPWDIGHEAPPLYAGNSCITAKLGERMAIIFEANHNFDLDNSAAFIAHARQDVPALVAEVRRLTLAMSMISDCTPDGMVETKDGPFTVKQFAWRTLRKGKLVEDGCGNAWPPCKCGATMQVVRPGHAVCPMCGGGK